MIFLKKISWWDLDSLPELLFDHEEIIHTAIKDMRLKINHQPIGYNLLPREFTLKNLQSIYEAILDKKLDRANFNRKILSYGILDKKKSTIPVVRTKHPICILSIKKLISRPCNMDWRKHSSTPFGNQPLSRL